MTLQLAQWFLMFADRHWFLALWLLLCVTWILLNLVDLPFRFYNRLVRHLNIRKAGWPPVHCDADGDGVEAR